MWCCSVLCSLDFIILCWWSWWWGSEIHLTLCPDKCWLHSSWAWFGVFWAQSNIFPPDIKLLEYDRLPFCFEYTFEDWFRCNPADYFGFLAFQLSKMIWSIVSCSFCWFDTVWNMVQWGSLLANSHLMILCCFFIVSHGFGSTETSFAAIFGNLIKFWSVWNKFGAMNIWAVLIWHLTDGLEHCLVICYFLCPHVIWTTIWHDLHLHKSNWMRLSSIWISLN